MVSPAHSFFSLGQTVSGQRRDVARFATAVGHAQLHIPSVALATAVAYYFGTKFGYAFTPATTPIGTLWPPNAILLGVLLLTPARSWAVLLGAVLPAHLLAQLGAGVPPAAAIGWFCSNVGEALVGAACICHFGRREQRPLSGLRGIVVFVLFGVLVAPLITSFLDAAVAVLTGQGNGYWLLWTTRLSSNMLSELVFVPIVVLFGIRRLSWIRGLTLGRATEAILLVVGTVIVSLLIFGTGNLIGNIPALICAPLAFLLWAALRFDLSILSTSLLAVALISIWNAMSGHGPLPRTSLTEDVLFLQFFLLGFTLPLVLLQGYRVEQRRASASLIQTRNRLINWEEEQRQRIGRELHDDIVQRLALIAVEVDRLGATGRLAGDVNIQSLYQEVTQVSEATRQLSHQVHPFVLEYAGLGPALRSLFHRVSQQSGIHISLSEHEANTIPEDASLCLYRVAEEALQNVVKQSRASNVTVDLAVSQQSAVLRIVDDGIGIAAEESVDDEIGLASVCERVMALNGVCDIVSATERGTTITATVPLQTESHFQQQN
jgi:signal transduction histidine kinase